MCKILRLNMVRAMMVGLFVLVSVAGKAQISGTNVGAIKSEQLTDEQLKKGIQKALEAGMTPTEIEAMARAQGMSSNEIQKLKARMGKMYGSGSGSDFKKEGTDQTMSSKKEKSRFNYKTIDYPDYFGSRSKNGTPAIDERNFGFSLFTNNDLTFEPSTNMATPKNYQLDRKSTRLNSS